MTGLLHEQEFSRKTFLKGGAMVVGVCLTGAGLTAKTASGAFNPDGTLVDSWLTINVDNTVTLKTSQIDVGNGTTTGLLQILAEELDVSMDQVHHAVWDSTILVNSGTTGGSTGIQSSGGPPLRSAAASAKQALLALAATNLGVPVSSLSVSKGVVSGGGKTVTYGQLVGGKLLNVKLVAPTLAPGVSPAKPVGDYKVVTSRVPRIDIPAKAMGTYTYVHNVRVPGMLHGRVVRPRGQGAYGTGAPIVSVDEKSIANIPGAQIVRKGDFLGVVAPKEYDAIQAASQLKVTWKENPILPSSGNMYGLMRQQDSAGQARAATTLNQGNVDAAMASAAKTVSQTYKFPVNERAVIGPACAIASVTPTSATIYTSSQQMVNVHTDIANFLGMDTSQVRVYWYEGSSSFGGGGTFPTLPHEAAALMSQVVGKPVRVQLMRWDEMGWNQYQQAQLMDVRGGVDANGKLVAFDYTVLAQPSTALDLTRELTGTPYPAPGNATVDTPNTAQAYDIPNKRLTGKTLPLFNGYFKVGSMRNGGGGVLVAFAVEQLIDELAYAAKMDPIAFRRQNITDDRWLTALNAAATAANWQPRVANSVKQTGDVVKGRGFGFGRHGTAGYSAGIVEVQVDKKSGKVTATHIYNGLDAGLAVNPGLVENQMTGASIQGLSRILTEEVRFSKSRVTSIDWVTYPILRFKDHPAVTNVLVQRTDKLPLGVGEPPITPISAAVANAFFDATGVRIREAPLTPARVRATLKAAGVA
jgi:CO/xanthine dehydrogenase Mo-binding subunit